MLELSLSTEVRRLSAAEKQQFREQGYVKNLPVFDAAAVEQLQHRYREMAALLPDGIDISRINNWHKANRWYYELCRTPAILDYVEDLLGPDFLQWGGQFFVKYPRDGSRVPWHQDAQYWPLTPRRTVTVWLALFDSDEENGAMQVVAGSHRDGEFEHRTNPDPQLVLDQEVTSEHFDPGRVVTLDLKAGEISLHDDGLLHGSLANESDRMRVGATMRFCPPEVRCDLTVWPTFETYPARGEDRFGNNPPGKLPTGEGHPVKRFQHSSEFA